VAGIGGFSGRESDVSVSWHAQEVSMGKTRWVLDEESTGGSVGGLPGDTRTGAKKAMAAVARACVAVTLPSSGSTSTGSTSAAGATSTSGSGAAGRQSAAGGSAALYDCQGRAQALAAVGA
jgi:hypothetical protein